MGPNSPSRVKKKASPTKVTARWASQDFVSARIIFLTKFCEQRKQTTPFFWGLNSNKEN